ncbi:hypothetical protein MMC34_002314 [Xylographa carneopallida]|nr:hypothetical protein [Xylographa carneopallida]
MAFLYLRSLLTLLITTKLVLAATVTYNWDITWVSVNPDSRHVRSAIGINGQWPCPTINANVGDTVIVNVNNHLGNQSTSLHWHGLFQQGTNAMDGPVGVTQCAIPPGGSYTYEFTINQPGTYWYHSHMGGQYPDGLRGPLIVHDPHSPYAGKYDEEIVLSLSDWYHEQFPTMLSSYLSATLNPSGNESIPYSNLVNDAQNIQLAFQPGKTYFVRVVSMAAFAATYVHFDQHTMTIVEVDGVYTQPQTVDSLYVTAAQRYGVLITAKPSAAKNYAFVSTFDLDMFNTLPSYLRPSVTGYLVYDAHAPLPAPLAVPATDPPYAHFDDFDLVPYDQEPLLPAPSTIVTYAFSFTQAGGKNIAVMNNSTYVSPLVPTLFTALTAPPNLATNPRIYGPHTNPAVLPANATVEIRLNNLDGGAHPFHLHGHPVQVVARSAPNVFAETPAIEAFAPSPNANASLAALLPPAVDYSATRKVPMRRDTVQVPEMGFVVLRFVADNPGVWLLHCHIEWHVAAGLSATMIEAPVALQQRERIPFEGIQLCVQQGTPVGGNALGNSVDWLAVGS